MVRRTRHSGFTLLEVLVAISIFAVIGLGANQMLRTMIDTHDKTSAKIASMNNLTRVFAALERDFSHAIPRFTRDEFGDPQPPLMIYTGQYPVELTRSGWSNPINLPRSNLQRVAYEVNADGELVRLFWLVLDRAEDSEPIEQIMLSGVEDFRLRLVTREGESTEVWPDGNFDALLPAGIELYLQTEEFGELRKVFALVDEAVASTDTSTGTGDNNDDQDGTSDNGESGDSSSDDPDLTNAVEES